MAKPRKRLSDAEAIRLGEEAKILLQNPVVNEAFDAIENVYSEKLFATKPNEGAERERLYQAAMALADLRNTLTEFVNTGTLKKSTAEKLERSKK